MVEEDGPASVRIVSNTTMELRIRPGSGRDEREATLLRWYRSRLREQIPRLLAKWEPRVGVEVAEVRVRRMKTRWGTCTSEDRRIWLNLELIKKPACCLEYILVHEMVHFLERHHNDRFRDLMDEITPQWRTHRDELNRSPLAHAEWNY